MVFFYIVEKCFNAKKEGEKTFIKEIKYYVYNQSYLIQRAM